MVFTAVNVGLTMVLGTLIALLLTELGPVMRIARSPSALVLAWAMPVVVAAQLWLWMTNYENGVLNYVLTKLHVGDFIQYDWFANPIVGFGVITSLIVWGAIPFVAITVYAGLTQVPGELLEAAEIDGSGAFRRFRDVTFPILKPIFVILTSLSIIWDFQVFTQPFLLRLQRPDPDYWLMSIYAYEKSFGISQYGLGSAIALVMLLMMLGVTFFYVRQMVRIGEVAMSVAGAVRPGRRPSRRLLRRVALNLAGLVVFVVMVFPVYWMVATAFKPGVEITSYTPTWIPRHPTLVHFTDAIHRPYFWDDVQEQPDRRHRRGRALGRARVPRRGRARQVPLHAAARCSSS